ncbi:neurturin-like isoform X1 [Lates japonicus]|uniref:Neurturin-like isoform X1 n=1 Tax=Lates japonicus TaxID=270547 RepID=A0AAD3RCJ4_LATJO|nr:neurturin-like isoform X1 [Lates japonicus]
MESYPLALPVLVKAECRQLTDSRAASPVCYENTGETKDCNRWKNLVEAGTVDYPASPEELEEDVFSEEDNKEAQAHIQHVLRQSSWPPAEALEQDSSVHTPWPDAYGK